MTMTRAAHTATLLPDGRVPIAGGYGRVLFVPDGDGNDYDSAEIYQAFEKRGGREVPDAHHSS
jgi:hypothetical protein